MDIERKSSVALYVQIAGRVAQDIRRRRYRPFERLPSEQRLVARYRVSRVTVRQALALLRRQGLVIAKQGKGTFVAGPVMRHELEGLRGFYDALVGQGLSPQTRLLEYRPGTAPKEVAARLGADGNEPVHLKRLYSVEGHPFALIDAWLAPGARKASWEEAERHPIYSILENLLRAPVARAEVSIFARGADAEETRLLELPEASAVLVMERVSYGKAGRALECSRFSIRPENYRFGLEVHGPLAITRMIREVARAQPERERKRRKAK